MKYEVAQKFPVDDLPALTDRFDMLGATIGKPQEEVDLYFAHPGRDFAKTDEALRIRRKGASNMITYKGPKIDKTTKTRHEIELPLPSENGTAEAWIGLLEVLGFEQVGEVRKSRRKVGIIWGGHWVEGSLDEVEGLGTFAELELIVEENQLAQAKSCIVSLAKALQLSQSERRSYLELLLT